VTVVAPCATRAWTAVLVSLCAACGDGSGSVPTTPKSGSRADCDALLFRDVTQASGVAFEHHAGVTPQHYLLETMGGGVAVIDYDGDGKQDLYFVDSGAAPADTGVQASGTSRLYRNLGALRFEDVTAKAGVAGRGYGMGAAAGDYDNDGDQDLYVTNYGSNILYRNNGDGTFSDVTRAAGCDDARWSTGAAFLDFDRVGEAAGLGERSDFRTEGVNEVIQRRGDSRRFGGSG